MSGWLFCALLTVHRARSILGVHSFICRSNSLLQRKTCTLLFSFFELNYSCHNSSFASVRLNPPLFTLPSTSCPAIVSSLSQTKICSLHLITFWFLLYLLSSSSLISVLSTFLSQNLILCQDQGPSSTDSNLRKLFLRIKDELWSQFGAVYNKKNMTRLRCCVWKNTFDNWEQREKSVGWMRMRECVYMPSNLLQMCFSNLTKLTSFRRGFIVIFPAGRENT